MNEARLYRILYLKREHDTIGEEVMVEDVLNPYDPDIYLDGKDGILAYGLTIPMPDGSDSRTLFCAHVDTVHHVKAALAPQFKVPAADDYLNNFRLDAINEVIYADGDVLGADDGAGVWLLLEMIDAGVPGTYVFHRGEECGGIGSRGMSADHAQFLSQFDRAIAFDRKATHSVITHQRGGRCCSDEFALELARHLSCDTYFMAPDDGGVFTDTANYIDDIGECTNVSVGYYDEHTSKERLDLKYLFALRSKCLTVDWEALPTVRKAGEIDPDYKPFSFKPLSRLSSFNSANYKDDDYYSDVTLEELYEMEYDQVLEMCEADPITATSLMWDLMYGAQPLAQVAPVDAVIDQGDYFDQGAINFDGDDNDFYDHDVFPRLKVGMQ